MGKKKNKTVNASLWGHANPKKFAELKDRYNVEGEYGGKPSAYGGSGNPRDKEDVYNDIMAAARNDYDTRRSLEAAGLAGNKKAAKMSAGGFNNITDVAKTQNILSKLKKKHVGGGGMGGAENIMGLTDALVNLDRDRLLDKIGEKGKETPLDRARDTFNPGDTNTLGPEAAKAFGYVGAYEDFQKAGGMTATRFGDADEQAAAAQQLADAYKAGVKNTMSPSFKMEDQEGIFL